LTPKSEKTILIVDDDINYRIILSRILSNYNILTAESGDEALEKINSDLNINLILCDIEMPGLNGFELVNKIKNDFPALNVPVVFVSARSDLASYVEGFELGAEEYITKPFESEQVIKIVEDKLKSDL